MEPSYIIALYSSCPQSGKSTVADIIFKNRPNVTVLSFAAPIKEMVYEFLKQANVENPLYYMSSTGKEVIIPNLGVSCRHLLQTLGTEWGRDCINKDIWIQCMEEKIQRAKKEGKIIVIEDVRFLNEYEFLKRHDAFFIKVVRDSTLIPTYRPHPSERCLDSIIHDFYINNSSTFDVLQHYVCNALRVIEEY